MQIDFSHHKKIQDHLNEVYFLPPPGDDEYIISTHLSGHDRTIVIAKGREIIEVIEAERLFNLKNGDWEVYKVAKNYPTNSYEHTTQNMHDKYSNLLFKYIDDKYYNCEIKLHLKGNRDPYLKKEAIVAHHHSSHALGAFYQSPFNEALTITYDGGSPDHVRIGIFYLRRGKRPILVKAFDNTIVGRYQDLGLLFECLEWQPAKAAHTLPGKIMALASFGKPNLELLPIYKCACSGLLLTSDADKGYKSGAFKPEDFYTTRKMKQLMDTNHYDNNCFTKESLTTLYEMVCKRTYIIHRLLVEENIPNATELAPLALAYFGINYLKKFNQYDETIFKKVKRIPDEKAFNMAATLQLACEELFFDNVGPFLNQFPNIPIVLAGGGALNIILNSRIKKETGRKVFVGPDSSDCGLALGAMLGYLRPEKPYSNPYTGMPILDINMLGSTLMEYVGLNTELSKYSVVNDVRSDIPYIAKLISEGKIIGVMRGNSERGPRALGNRSIICSASLPHIKDTLNAKVKFREWFRPFAPIVRLQDVNKYFDWEGESRYMNFCIDVREEYQDKLQAITHVDGTARVQTITREQNWFIYNILTELDKLTGIGVIVNTSFNVNGRPLINSVRDAFYMLENTELDGIIVQSTLVLKK